jgi:hypothetical protein
MAKYESDAPKSAVAFSYKKLMDVMLRCWDRMHNSPQHLRAKRVFCLVRLKEEAIAEGKDAEWVRNCGDLAEAYSAVKMFSFYFEVVKKTEGEEGDGGGDDLSSDMRDLDDIVSEAFKKPEEEKGVLDPEKFRKKRSREGFAFLSNKNQQNSAYNSQRESCDLSSTFSTSLEFGQMMYGAVGHFFHCTTMTGRRNLGICSTRPRACSIWRRSSTVVKTTTTKRRSAFPTSSSPFLRFTATASTSARASVSACSPRTSGVLTSQSWPSRTSDGGRKPTACPFLTTTPIPPSSASHWT